MPWARTAHADSQLRENSQSQGKEAGASTGIYLSHTRHLQPIDALFLSMAREVAVVALDKQSRPRDPALNPLRPPHQRSP